MRQHLSPGCPSPGTSEAQIVLATFYVLSLIGRQVFQRLFFEMQHFDLSLLSLRAGLFLNFHSVSFFWGAGKVNYRENFSVKPAL